MRIGCEGLDDDPAAFEDVVPRDDRVIQACTDDGHREVIDRRLWKAFPAAAQFVTEESGDPPLKRREPRNGFGAMLGQTRAEVAERIIAMSGANLRRTRVAARPSGTNTGRVPHRAAPVQQHNTGAVRQRRQRIDDRRSRGQLFNKWTPIGHSPRIHSRHEKQKLTANERELTRMKQEKRDRERNEMGEKVRAVKTANRR